MDGKIQWHPAFYSAIQIELQEDADALTFKEEHPLSKKPMQIDIVIIKKLRERKIHKKIGHIFRGHNLIEYKSPDDWQLRARLPMRLPAYAISAQIKYRKSFDKYALDHY